VRNIYVYRLTFQTATTIAFCLYFLSHSLDWQEKLYEEIKDIDLAGGDLQVSSFFKLIFIYLSEIFIIHKDLYK